MSKTRLLAILICSLMLSLGCNSGTRIPTTGTPPTTLNVALYPYVPRLDQFKQAVKNAWTQKEPNVTLNFVEWDCYSTDPPADLDVFVYDGIFLDYFVGKGYLAPLTSDQIDNFGDLLSYAKTDTKVNNQYYGIPQLGCGNLLYYRRGDDALAKAENLQEIAKVIGNCTDDHIPPPKGVNLLADLSGGTTDSCLYLETVQDITGQYAQDPPLPPANNLNPAAILNLNQLVVLGCSAQAGYDATDQYQRAAWFGSGLGRATIGFTEAMSAMGDGRKTVEFKLMPFANNDNLHLFYIDLAGINASIADPTRKSLALKLANLLTSTDVLIASIGPTDRLKDPQYLMPTRTSVFAALAKSDPIYQKMSDLVSASNPRMFRIGSNSKTWLRQNKSAIKKAIFAGAKTPTYAASR